MPYMHSQNAEHLVNTYSDMILRISYMYLKQTCDAEDICQEVFIKLLCGDYKFESSEHEKSWIIRTTINACKDHLRTDIWKRAVGMENMPELKTPEEPDSELIELVMKLPKNYRISIYLHYYEGYRIKEIASMMGKSENTISAYLSRGRKKLRLMIETDSEGRSKGAISHVR